MNPVPTFDLPTTEGGRFSTSQLEDRGVPTFIVFGSRSCPVTESGADGLVGLHERDLLRDGHRRARVPGTGPLHGTHAERSNGGGSERVEVRRVRHANA